MTDSRDVARCWAGFASLGAGLVHLAVVREHLSEDLTHGLFFLVTGLAQLAWGVLALGRDRIPLPRLVAVAQVAMLLLWAVSRTVGLPVPPDPWVAEAVGRADVLSVALELVASVAVLAWLTAGHRRTTIRPGRFVALVGAGALVVSMMTTPALAATDAGKHAHAHGSHGL